jgi:hypothetical protein
MKRFFLICVLSVSCAVGCGNVPNTATRNVNNNTSAATSQNGNGAAQTASPTAQASPSPVAQSLDVVVREFYQWYLRSLKRDEDPFGQGLTTMRRYVSNDLITELQRQRNSPDGMEFDYFLQAQDWGEDWETNVSVTGTELRGTTATTVAALGPRESVLQQRLRVTLRQQADGWRITAVENTEQ